MNQRDHNQRNHTPEEIKKKHFWALKDGDIFKYGNSFWIHEQGEITPYKFGDDLKNGVVEMLSQLGMKLNDIPSTMTTITI